MSLSKIAFWLCCYTIYMFVFYNDTLVREFIVMVPNDIPTTDENYTGGCTYALTYPRIIRQFLANVHQSDEYTMDVEPQTQNTEKNEQIYAQVAQLQAQNIDPQQ